MDTPGAKLLCRNSYEDKAISPFDHPLSSRFDENDAVLLFDNAFIPWENVLVYRDVERANTFYRGSGFFSRYNLQSGTRLGVKLDFMAGLFAKGIAANGTDEFRGVQVALGEIIGWRNLIWALTLVLCMDPQPGPGDCVIPKMENAATLRLFSHECWAAIHSIFETFLGGAPTRRALQLQRPAQPRSAPTDRQILSRLGEQRGGARQTLQTDLGRHRHGVRRAARTLRAQLLRQQRANPP